MENQKSELELALEYIADHPELVDRVSPDEFGTFYQYPEEVIKLYEKTIYMMKTSFQFTDEMVAEYCLDYLGDACRHIQYLKDKEAQNS